MVNINFIHPFALDKKYGRELNRCVAMIPDGQWICIMDLDTMILSHKQIPIMYEYIERYPDVGLFLATSNRSGSHNKQRYQNVISKNSDISYWLMKVDEIVPTYKIHAPIKNFISGHLMLFKKDLWNINKFDENLDVLGVDRTFAQGVLDNGKQIGIMEDILIWHTYRLLTGSLNKDHLQ